MKRGEPQRRIALGHLHGFVVDLYVMHLHDEKLRKLFASISLVVTCTINHAAHAAMELEYTFQFPQVPIDSFFDLQADLVAAHLKLIIVCCQRGR